MSGRRGRTTTVTLNLPYDVDPGNVSLTTQVARNAPVRIALYKMGTTTRAPGALIGYLDDPIDLGASAYLNGGGEIYFTLPALHPYCPVHRAAPDPLRGRAVLRRPLPGRCSPGSSPTSMPWPTRWSPTGPTIWACSRRPSTSGTTRPRPRRRRTGRAVAGRSTSTRPSTRSSAINSRTTRTSPTARSASSPSGR